MKKNIKKYIITFLSIIFILFILLVLIAKIPNKYVNSNIKKSVSFYETHDGIHKEVTYDPSTYLHYYSDSTLLNIIYNIDTNHPVKSIMAAKLYFEKTGDINYNFIKSVTENKKANYEYLRYWHGSIILLKPLLILFDVDYIYNMNLFLLSVLALTLFILLFLKDKKLSFIYLLSLIVVNFLTVPKCFAFSSTFYIMFISSILTLYIKNDEKFYYMLFINGILTCFFDFLTTEILTLLMPVLIYLYFNKDRFDLKSGFKFIIKSYLIWFISYLFTWLTKWLFASLVLQKNVMPYVKDRLLLRINGLQGTSSHKIIYLGALIRNIECLYPLNIFINFFSVSKFLIFILLIILIIFNFNNLKKLKEKKICLLFLFLAVTPYLRYLLLANHSYFHYFFTFRDQIITIMSLIITFVIYNKK